jgi:hypothetical protein
LPNNAGNSDVTQINEEDFGISLPGKWEQVPLNDGWKYICDQRGEELVVSVLRAKKTLSVQEIRDAVARLVTIRRDSHLKISNGRVEMEQAELRACGERVESRFQGIDHAHDVRFSVAIRGNGTRLVTASLFHYGPDNPSLPFNVGAGVILDLLRVTGD